MAAGVRDMVGMAVCDRQTQKAAEVLIGVADAARACCDCRVCRESSGRRTTDEGRRRRTTRKRKGQPSYFRSGSSPAGRTGRPSSWLFRSVLRRSHKEVAATMAAWLLTRAKWTVVGGWFDGDRPVLLVLSLSASQATDPLTLALATFCGRQQDPRQQHPQGPLARQDQDRPRPGPGSLKGRDMPKLHHRGSIHSVREPFQFHDGLGLFAHRQELFFSNVLQSRDSAYHILHCSRHLAH